MSSSSAVHDSPTELALDPGRQTAVHPIGQHAASVAVLVCVVLSSWLVAGSGNLPLIEEWRLLAAFDGAGQYLYNGGAHQSLHPLIGVPALVAYLLSPQSLSGFSFTLGALLVAKTLTVYALIQIVTDGDNTLAFLGAGLFGIYPSDEGTFLFRTLNAHAAVLCALIAVAVLARLWVAPARVSRWLPLVCCAQAVSLAMYDIAYPFLFVAPLLIWLVHPGRPVARRLLAWWYAIPAVLGLNLLQMMFLRSNTGLYQAGVLSIGDHLIHRVVGGLDHAYAANLWDGWRRASTAFQIASRATLLLAVAMGIVVLLLVLTLERRSAAQREPRSRGYYLRWLLAGVLVIGVGVSPYLPTIYWADRWRVFFLASLGGALVVAAACTSLRLVSRRGGMTAVAGVAGVVLTVAMVHAGTEHRRVADLGQRARVFLGSVARQAPALRAPAAIVVINREPVADDHLRLFFDHGDLIEAIEYLYQDYRNLRGVHVCEQDQSPRGVTTRTGCEFGVAGVEVFDEDHSIGAYRYDEIVMFVYSARDGYRLLSTIPDDFAGAEARLRYRPDALIDRTVPMPARAQAIGGQDGERFDRPEPGETIVAAYSFEADSQGWVTPNMPILERRSRPTVDGLVALHAQTAGLQMATSPTIHLLSAPSRYAASAWVYVGKGAARFGLETAAGRTLAATNVYTTDRWVRLCIETNDAPPQSDVRLYVDDYHLASEFWLDMITLSRGTCST